MNTISSRMLADGLAIHSGLACCWRYQKGEFPTSADSPQGLILRVSQRTQQKLRLLALSSKLWPMRTSVHIRLVQCSPCCVPWGRPLTTECKHPYAGKASVNIVLWKSVCTWELGYHSGCLLQRGHCSKDAPDKDPTILQSQHSVRKVFDTSKNGKRRTLGKQTGHSSISFKYETICHRGCLAGEALQLGEG
eukprot:3084722-Amphidinium_carterae.1